MTTDLRSQAARVAAMRATSDHDVRVLAAKYLLGTATFFGVDKPDMVDLMLTKNGVNTKHLAADFDRILGDYAKITGA